MIKCPMCRELLSDDARQCRKCETDLTLLADYVSHLREGPSQAEACTRAGELGDAVWAYLAVLEIDPDNATARRQVGQVATAVRQFDQVNPPGRRWIKRRDRPGLLRRLFAPAPGDPTNSAGWLHGLLLWFFLPLGAFLLGYAMAHP